MLDTVAQVAKAHPADEIDSDLAHFWAWALDPNEGMCLEVKDLGDGRYAGIRRLLYHYTMAIGRIGDMATYEDRYCYQTLGLASAAMSAWDGTGEPLGWHRHPSSGRRRPNGNPALEYIEH